MPSDDSLLQPALILGSGFHRHVLGQRSRPDHREALYDWHALIDAVADRMHVACPSREQPPVLRWETLIGRAVREVFVILQANHTCRASCRPFGMEPLLCNDWDEGWQRLLDTSANQDA